MFGVTPVLGEVAGGAGVARGAEEAANGMVVRSAEKVTANGHGVAAEVWAGGDPKALAGHGVHCLVKP